MHPAHAEAAAEALAFSAAAAETPFSAAAPPAEAAFSRADEPNCPQLQAVEAVLAVHAGTLHAAQQVLVSTTPLGGVAD